jgi:hypothetical protein
VNQITATKYTGSAICLGALPADTNWHYVVVSGDASGTYVYIDGTKSTSASVSNWATYTGNFLIGYDGSNYFNGSIDEVHVSNTTRSPDWVITEYNNQSAPNTFIYQIGNPVTR